MLEISNVSDVTTLKKKIIPPTECAILLSMSVFENSDCVSLAKRNLVLLLDFLIGMHSVWRLMFGHL